MASSKQVLVALLGLIVVVICAGTPARADSGSATLAPCGDEPGASGKASLTRVWIREGKQTYTGTRIKVACTGLTPGQVYGISGVQACFTADDNGRLVASGDTSFWPPNGAGVEVFRGDGWFYYVPVLYGEIVWSGQ